MVEDKSNGIEEGETLLPHSSSRPIGFMEVISNREVLISCLMIAGSTAIVFGIDDIRSIFFETSRDNGGLGLSASTTGLLSIVVGVTMVLSYPTWIPSLLTTIGLIPAFQWTMGLFIVYFGCFYFVYLVTPGVWMWLYLIVWMVLRGSLFGINHTSSWVLVNNSIPHRDHAAKVTAFAETLICLSSLFGIALNGVIWSVTMRLDMYLHQSVVFTISSLLSLVMTILSLYIPPSLSNPKNLSIRPPWSRETKDEVGFQNQ